MRTTFLVSMFALFMLWWSIIRIRRRVARLQRAIEDLTRRTHELIDVGQYDGKESCLALPPLGATVRHP
jgi:hypothetical protein